jgi:electron transfer flavoprotein alpha subunit
VSRPAAVVTAPGLDVRRAVAAIGGLGADVVAFGFGQGAVEAADAAGIQQVDVLAEEPVAGEVAARLLAGAARGRDVELLVLPAAVRWTEVAAALAVDLDAACLTDVTALRRGDDGHLMADRYCYGGLVTGTYALQRPRTVLTMAGISNGDGVDAAPAVGGDGVKVLTGRVPLEQTADLGAARRIVAVGRGLRDAGDLPMVEELADALGAAVACTRPLAEDLGWLPKERQVGLTGHTVRPELYLALGISGQVQHVVGMRDSDVVVAVNTNPAAPIFEVADIGAVGDLYEIVPRLVDALVRRVSAHP